MKSKPLNNTGQDLLKIWLEKRKEENTITTTQNLSNLGCICMHKMILSNCPNLCTGCQWSNSSIRVILSHLYLHNSSLADSMKWISINYKNVLKSSNQNSMGFQIPTSELSEVPRLPRLPRCWAVATNVSAAWHPMGRPPGAPGGSTTRGLQKAYCWPSSTGCAAPESHGIGIHGIHDIHGGWVRSYLIWLILWKIITWWV